jgi:hypothetical protein
MSTTPELNCIMGSFTNCTPYQILLASWNRGHHGRGMLDAWETWEMRTKFYPGYLKGKGDHLGNLDTDKRIILKCV